MTSDSNSPNPAQDGGTTTTTETSDATDAVADSKASMSLSDADTLVELQNVRKYYPIRTGLLQRHTSDVKAVDGVSFDIREGETFGLVGESGCGKSTLGKTVLHLLEPTSGQVIFDGTDLSSLSSAELRQRRRNIQIIFQDPASSLNPRMSVEQLIEEPMASLTDWSKDRRKRRVHELIQEVGLSVEHLPRRPHEFSGGQQQRIAIARALSVNPQFIVADEPTSALDVSVQAKILNLLKDLQAEYDLTFLFISHDLSVIRNLCDRVAVMYLGEIAEIAPTKVLFDRPKHPYTKALLSSVPTMDGLQDDRIQLEGDVPSPENPPTGCRYHTRCQEYIGPICEEESPELKLVDDAQICACHHYE